MPASAFARPGRLAISLAWKTISTNFPTPSPVKLQVRVSGRRAASTKNGTDISNTATANTISPGVRALVEKPRGYASGQPPAAVPQVEQPERQIPTAFRQNARNQGFQQRVLGNSEAFAALPGNARHAPA